MICLLAESFLNYHNPIVIEIRPIREKESVIQVSKQQLADRKIHRMTLLRILALLYQRNEGGASFDLAKAALFLSCHRE